MKKNKIKKRNRKGQLLIEAIWLVLFSCAFLTLIAHLYEKGQKEIQQSRFFSLQKNFERKIFP